MNIFKEYTENQKRAKERIKREKMAAKEKHDRMMDSARTRDTRRKNAMEEVEFHVRLDHLDGDSRQKKASAVMRKHERAGHVEYVGNTDKGVVFKAKSKSHADRLHRELKPHATGVEHMNEAKSAQDPDIKDREGTQPAAYHKGLKKTTKAKRDAHFKKYGKKADDDASAYKDAPGDKKARKGDMPKSKYTKFVDNMMKEKYRPPTEAEKAADKKKDQKADGDRYKSMKKKVYGNMMGGLKKEGTDFAAHRAAKATAPTDSDRKKMAKVADLLRKEREKKAAMKEEDEHQFGNKTEEKEKDLTPQQKAERAKQRQAFLDRLRGKPPVKEAMSPESQKAHSRMFKAAQKKKDDSAAQAEREKRLKAKGWVKNDRGGMSKVSEEADKSLAAKAAKSGISVGTLRKVYNRGVAAWKTGHRPGTTPSQWGHARVNAFITKKKKGGLNHDKDLA